MKANKKNINNTLAVVVGILLFIISYNLDKEVSLFFKNAKLAFFDVIFSTITNFGVVVLVMLLIPSFILYKKNRKAMHLLLMAFLVSFLFAFIMKLVILRQRPMDAFTYPFTHIINYSFPSMHSMVAFSLLPLLAKCLPKQKSFWLIFAFSVAFSRIYFGFHFLSDVVFGALAGYLIGSSLLALYRKGKLWHYGNKQL